ncbi:DUF3500 domain-containing protein [Rubinisphaera sp. JC750]|uniref:DUF3500 domain-containing protein n=1 Tax=Rubinisphaera sp. JC750 TaxID=2898658 RepID=UPI001F440862|nr:DUF3500 domain-containing protein [Rubinisphaera sp. JC750]
MFQPRQLILALFVIAACCPLFVSSDHTIGKTSADVSAQKAAVDLLNSLDDSQLKTTLHPYDSERRVDWHFIPMETRKGLKLRDMSKEQRQTGYQLLRSSLSQAGYRKARSIMNLEKLLYSLEAPASRERRDYLKYYFTMFGDPREDKTWGLSIEGHHMSLNFVFEGDKMVASTPQFFATNPAEIKTKNDLGFELGAAVLKEEEQLGFELVNSLEGESLKTAMIADKAPAEIRNPGEPHPPQEDAVGLAAGDMTKAQQELLRRLIREYANAVPRANAKQRLKEIEEGNFETVHFAWAGATKPGIGHYYRIQGPSFLIEFVNTQPDVAGNPANHVHCVWRDMDGDFALSAK